MLLRRFVFAYVLARNTFMFNHIYLSIYETHIGIFDRSNLVPKEINMAACAFYSYFRRSDL